MLPVVQYIGIVIALVRVDPACECPHNEYAFSKWVFDNYVRINLDRISNKVIGFRFGIVLKSVSYLS